MFLSPLEAILVGFFASKKFLPCFRAHPCVIYRPHLSYYLCYLLILHKCPHSMLTISSLFCYIPKFFFAPRSEFVRCSREICSNTSPIFPSISNNILTCMFHPGATSPQNGTSSLIFYLSDPPTPIAYLEE